MLPGAWEPQPDAIDQTVRKWDSVPHSFHMTKVDPRDLVVEFPDLETLTAINGALCYNCLEPLEKCSDPVNHWTEVELRKIRIQK